MVAQITAVKASKSKAKKARVAALRKSGGSKTHRAIKRSVFSREQRHKLNYRQRTVSDILRLSRKTWINLQNTKTAAHGDSATFRKQLRAAHRAVDDSIQRSALIIRDSRRHLSKAQLAQMYNAMTEDYTRGLRALTEVLLAKDRMHLDKVNLPAGVLGHMAKMQGPIQTVTKHTIHKMIAHYKKQIKQVVKHAIKKTIHREVTKNKPQNKVVKQAKIAGTIATHVAISVLHKHLVQTVGKKNARKIVRRVNRVAKRQIRKVVKKEKVIAKHEKKLVKVVVNKLQTVGKQVAKQITKEARAHGASPHEAARRGKMAGEAAVKFAAVLVVKKMKKQIGNKRTQSIVRQAQSKAFNQVHIAARVEAGIHKHSKAKGAKHHSNPRFIKNLGHKHKPHGKKTNSTKPQAKPKRVKKHAQAKKVVKKPVNHKKKLVLTQLSAATRQQMMAFIAAHSKH